MQLFLALLVLYTHPPTRSPGGANLTHMVVAKSKYAALLVFDAYVSVANLSSESNPTVSGTCACVYVIAQEFHTMKRVCQREQL